ncbi:PilX N-terminal domain-containing pilus assembly protein [Alkalilimnicola sp. S0819]|uniref:pilus assembly PilX family protein n=1 Tax=Alkalilimnicola sp. S0819 TaxID=2613922 RepID=UPI001261C7AD|nr:pilus assembly protein [Alkalilimnicola sp. S0819]KAB7623153.1 hypothetical protein F3N43_10160 [Alkalilimnicola sp. S0819]MPQ16997.1 hypothetical protein [Alkalilimnicola sp. S0819]
MTRKPTHQSRHAQRGAALAISLILLLVMTLLGVSAMRGTTLEEKMAGNTRNRSIAFQAAEAALREAETTLTGYDAAFISANFGDGVGNGLYDSNHDADPHDNTLWQGTRSVAANAVPGTAALPRYYIKEIGFVPGTGGSIGLSQGVPQGSGGITVFEITAQGTGGDTDAQVVLRTRYGLSL